MKQFVSFNITKMARLFQSVQKNCMDGNPTEKHVLLARVVHMLEIWESAEHQEYGSKDDTRQLLRDVLDKMDSGEIVVIPEMTRREYNRYKKQIPDQVKTIE